MPYSALGIPRAVLMVKLLVATFTTRYVRAAACAAVLLLTGCATASTGALQANSRWVIEKPMPCVTSRGAYCLFDGDLKLKTSSVSEGHVAVELEDPYVPSARAYLVEEGDCTRAFADKPAVTARKEMVRFAGQDLRYARIKLNDRGCAIGYYSTPGISDTAKSALAMLLTGFRPCNDALCLGPAFGAYISGLYPD